MNATSEMLIKLAYLVEYHKQGEERVSRNERCEILHVAKLYKKLNTVDFDLSLPELFIMSVDEVKKFCNE